MVEGVTMHLQCTVSGAQVGHILEQTRNILYFFLEFYFIFFPTSRIYLKTNKEHSIVFSLEYYWHRIRPIPMMTNPIHGPLSYRSLWMNSTFWSFFLSLIWFWPSKLNPNLSLRRLSLGGAEIFAWPSHCNRQEDCNTHNYFVDNIWKKRTYLIYFKVYYVAPQWYLTFQW